MNRMGVASPECSYVWIDVNGSDWGLYLAVEGVEDAFLDRSYGADSAIFTSRTAGRTAADAETAAISILQTSISIPRKSRKRRTSILRLREKPISETSPAAFHLAAWAPAM